MNTALAVLVIIFAGTWLCAYLGLWHSIDNIKDSLEYIKRECNNTCEINQSKYILLERIGESHKKLLTEIACLATKNNEDIKRMKGDYQQWDMIAFDGERWIIHKIDENVNGDTFYRVHNAKGQISNVSSKDMQHATFVKHVGSQFETEDKDVIRP